MKNLPDSVRWHIKAREKTSRKEALYILQVIKYFQKKLKEDYSSILDVACGNGRLHPFLRKFGLEVFGIDKSRELIEEARRKFPKFSDCYKQSDMRKFELKREFDIALSWFTSFGYFEDRDNVNVLKNINKHLRKKGLLLLDIPNGPLRVKRIQSVSNFVLRQGKFVEIVDNKLMKIRNQTFWVLEQSFYIKKKRDLKFIRKEKRKVRLYSIPEIRKLLNKTGFKVVKVLESMTLKKVNKSSQQMLVVAQKI